eukprot:GHVS01037646.1.p1 GENE.GHVS01037646.1~~GHVS01037646.1.p1  ORF type:complete len:452 (-),score=93.95 GHVS01037646.1:113-1468(-)
MAAAEPIDIPFKSSYVLHNNNGLLPSTTKAQTAATTTSPPSTHLVALLGADPLSPSSPILSASSPCSRFSLPAYQRRLGRLVTQRHQLRRDLAAYHKEFQERLGRCVRMQRDILPVERQYRQYTQTKEDIKKLQEVIAKLGGEVDEGRHEDKAGRGRREQVKIGGEEVTECRRDGLDGWHGEETTEDAEQQRRLQQQQQQIHPHQQQQSQQPRSRHQPHEQQSQQQQESQQPEQPHRQQQGREGRRLYTHVSRNLGTEAGDDSGTIRITNAEPTPSSVTSVVGSNSEDTTAPTYANQNFSQQWQQSSTSALSQRSYVGCYQNAAAPQPSYMLAKGSPHIVHPPDTSDLVPTQQSHHSGNSRGYYLPSGSSAPVGHGNNNNNAFTDPTSASSSPSNTVHRIGQASVTYGQNSSSFLLTRMHSEYQHNPQQQPLYTRQGSKTADSTLRRTPRS